MLAIHAVSRFVPGRDRVRGALVGAVVGDAFVAPLLGCAPVDVQRRLSARARALEPWRYTDSGAAFIALAESIRDVGTVSPPQFLTRLSERYDPERGFGRSLLLSMEAFQAGTSWNQVNRVAWREGSRGNGGAARVGAAALRRWTSASSLQHAALIATEVTHVHPEATGAALVQAALVALLLQEPELAEKPEALLPILTHLLPASPYALGLLGRVHSLLEDPVSRSELEAPAFARETVPAAIAAFLRAPGDFWTALTHAARLAGDVSAVGALVGCLAGAVHGLSGIPTEWLAALAGESPTPDELRELADALFDLEPAEFHLRAGE